MLLLPTAFNVKHKTAFKFSLKNKNCLKNATILSLNGQFSSRSSDTRVFSSSAYKLHEIFTQSTFNSKHEKRSSIQKKISFQFIAVHELSDLKWNVKLICYISVVRSINRFHINVKNYGVFYSIISQCLFIQLNVLFKKYTKNKSFF